MNGDYQHDRRGDPRDSDRRRERRVGTRLAAHLRLSAAFLHRELVEGEAEQIELYGSAHDVSASGIGIIIPSFSFDPRACSEGRQIRLTLDLSGKPMEVQAEAVRCAPIDVREPSEGFFLGVKLSEMSEQVRVMMAAHLKQVPEA